MDSSPPVGKPITNRISAKTNQIAKAIQRTRQTFARVVALPTVSIQNLLVRDRDSSFRAIFSPSASAVKQMVGTDPLPPFHPRLHLRGERGLMGVTFADVDRREREERCGDSRFWWL